MAKQKKAPTMGPVRTNLEAFGVAILAAVLLKWFCLEAYQIPTSSMQPTLMGSNEAGVYDRILVNKILQTFREPQRWDITVFQYPLQKNQNYVKRLVGMPGDRLHIAGGNLYLVSDVEGRRSYSILRKPDDLQAAMWKNVYPGRALARGDAKALGKTWVGRGFEEDGAGFVADLEGSLVRLYFRDEDDGGFVDRVWDGYPAATAREIREKTEHRRPQEIVPDARLAATITPSATLDEIAFEIDVTRPGLDKWTYALVVSNGKGRLQVRAKNTQVLGESPAFDCAVEAGRATELAFAHVDDALIAWRDGTELARFATDEWACREGCVLHNGTDPASAAKPDHAVVPQIVLKGRAKVRLDDVRLDRDQHYTRSGADEVIEVPEGHYFMMGDNTLQSIDSRDWTAIIIGVLDGKVVPPDTPGARIVRGNKRPMSLTNPPDRDETPIAIPSKNAIVMIDEFGEILRLEGQPGTNWGPGVVCFKNPDGNGEWVAPEVRNASGVSFVRRQDIQGRALMVFYPFRPLSWLMRSNWPDRFGFVR